MCFCIMQFVFYQLLASFAVVIFDILSFVNDKRLKKQTLLCVFVKDIHFVFITFTFMHLADAFIQSNLQYIQAIHFFISMCVYIVII